MAEGMPSNCVLSLHQDHLGIVWVGTDRGLWRYDGLRFTSPLGNDITMGVTALYDDGETLYVGFENGLFEYSFQTDSLKRSRLHFDDPRQTINTQVTWIGEDHNHNLWISTLGQGIFCRPQGAEYLEHYLFPDGVTSVTSLLIDNENLIWALSNRSNGQSLARFNQGNHRFELFKLRDKEGNILPTNGQVLFEDAANHLWIGTWENGLIRYEPHSRIAEHVLNASDAPLLHIHSIFQFDAHRFLIGSDEGLYLYHVPNNQGRTYTYSETDPESLTNPFVYPIMRDREGGIWVGTYFGGVNYMHPRTGAFVNYKPSPTRNSVSGLVISCMLEDEKGHIWTGSNDGGLSVYDPVTDHFETIVLRGKDKQPHNVHSLALRNDEVWVGTYSLGIDIYNRQNKSIRHYPVLLDELDNVLGTSCHALMKDSANQMWIGTDDGLCRFLDDKGCFQLVKSFGVRVYKILADHRGHIWVATKGAGIWRYTLETQAWRQFANRRGQQICNVVYDLCVDPRGVLWAGTMDGFLYYDDRKEEFHRVDVPLEQLPDVESITCEGATYWLGSSVGLVHYVPNGFEDDPSNVLRTYTGGDGLSCRNFLPGSSMISSDGRIYLGTSKGINAFYPYQLRLNKVVPSVFFTGIAVYTNSVLVDRPELSRNLNLSRRIELNHNENEIVISFAAPSYCQPEKNRYAYWLEGFDKKEVWMNLGPMHEAIYTHLLPGRYIFHVKASNNDNVWDDEETQLEIVVDAPFYWNAYSITFYLLLFVGIVLLLQRYQRRHNELKHQVQIDRIKQENVQKMQEARMRFFTTIAHEIRTPVSLIIAPMQKILQNTKHLPLDLRADLNVINSNSQRLLVLINQLLDFRKIEDGTIYYRFRPLVLKPLLESVVTQFEESFREKSIKLEVTYPNDDFMACVDREAMTKLVSNLLSNSLKYASKQVSMRSEVRDNLFVLTVSNDGAPIPESEKARIFLPFYQSEENKPGTGIGLSIVKGIVEAFHGEISVECGDPVGTSFVVSIPSDLPANVDPDETTADEAAEKKDAAKAESQESTTKPALLLVDDNVEMLHFLQESLCAHFQILTAENGLEAMKVLDEHVVSIIVSDWMMPEMDGEHLCRAVRRNPLTSHIPFILLTAKTDDESKIQGMNIGADQFVEKPFSLDYLKACINNLLKMRQNLIDNFQTQPLEPIEKLSSIPADQVFLKNLEDLIEKNFSNPDLNIDFLSRELGMSRSTFFNRIRELVDVSPNQMIQLVRLKHAARLLQEGGNSITQISYMVGFSNASYFAKCFQKQFGVTPGEFIKQKKE